MSQAQQQYESAYDVLDELGFFAYSGADGDLYRKNGLSGWRVSVYWGSDVRLQKKTATHGSRAVWSTQKQWVADPEKDLQDADDEIPEAKLREFKETLQELVKNGELSDD